MTPEEQRVAIAKACGWTDLQFGVGPNRGRILGNRPTEYGWVVDQDVPDYPNDLNAMREAELMLVGLLADSTGALFDVDGYRTYVPNLHRVVNGLPPSAYFHWSDLGVNEGVVSATAAQRAEAFLRTLNLWRDSKPA